MAMFDKHKSSRQTPQAKEEPVVARQTPEASQASRQAANQVAMIGKGISISGDVTATSNLRIEGRVEGRVVQGSQDVEISESGTVTANISARVVKISGEVNGDVSGGEKVMISRTGKVQGNIVAPRVQLEDGALFRGSIDMNPAKAPAKARSVEKKAATSATAPATRSTGTAGAENRKEPGLNLKSG